MSKQLFESAYPNCIHEMRRPILIERLEHSSLRIDVAPIAVQLRFPIFHDVLRPASIVYRLMTNAVNVYLRRGVNHTQGNSKKFIRSLADQL